MNHKRPFFIMAFAVFLLTAFCLLPSVFSQSASATLSGTVEDQTGAVIPGVTVIAINKGTQLSREAVTNEQGYFTIPLLPPGAYAVRAHAQGFGPVEFPNVVLNVGDQKALRIQLKAGDVNAQVVVQEAAPLLNTESAAVSTVVDRQFVENIPLNGRTLQPLILLTPGTVQVTGGGVFGGGNGGSGQFSINGQRTDGNSFMVDGVSANFASLPGSNVGTGVAGNLPSLSALGSTQTLSSLDAMQEFRVQTSNYSAEYGRQPGGQISVITRSGTNEFHGSLFDYIRNDVLDANDWFANRFGQPRAAERQNDFGGTFSGPVLLPRFGEGGRQPSYNGRNRTFFFFSYEGLRLRQAAFTLTNVPTLALRQIAASGLRPLVNAFPIPNGRDLGNGLAEFAASYTNPSALDATSIRIDHAINQKWNIFGRYNNVPSEKGQRTPYNLAVAQLDSLKAQTVTAGLTGMLSARSTNELRFNYSKNSGIEKTRYNDRTFGATPIQMTDVVPSQYVTSTSTLGWLLLFPGTNSPLGVNGIFLFDGLLQDQKQINIVENFSLLMGGHRLKFGVDYRRMMPFAASDTYRLGNIFYFSQQQVINNSPGSARISASVPAHPVFVNFSAYVQDSWRVSRRLSVDLGLRWDVNPSTGEANGNTPVAVDQISDLSTMKLAPRGTAQWKTTYNNFAPRLGLACQIGQRPGWETVIRGGFGVFYDTGNAQGAEGYTRPSPGFPFGAVRSAPGLAFPLTPTTAAPPPLPDLSNPAPPYGAMTVFDPHLKLPYVFQWNVSLQQSIGKDQALTLSYVGSAGRRLLQQRQLTLTTINPSFTVINLGTNRATSDYDAFQAQFQRRLSRGLQMLVSYTWSHALDFDSTNNGQLVPLRGNASFDVRHTFGSAVTYGLPVWTKNRMLRAFLGDWSLDGNFQARSALPVDIIASRIVNSATGELVASRPNVIVGVPFYIDDLSVPGGRRINRAAFSIPTAGQFGALGRNVLRGLGMWQFDLALRRQFKLTERLSLQFRAEAFNVFNHPNFGTIQTTLTAPNFGQATDMLNQAVSGTEGGVSSLYALGGPRSMQFAVRLSF